ncbi:MAG: hypothetical protein HYV16_01800 [Gammaproteobacteria bacterium]|nr:hypothetical protein [Gammaproteobacteria bacterium]
MLDAMKRQLISLLSLSIAFSALTYSTWRSERTEQNRNVREASFIILRELSALQLIADHAYYEKNTQLGNPVTGWGHLGLIRDLSQMTPPSVGVKVNTLAETWRAHWETLKEHEASNQQVTVAIDGVRSAVLNELAQLH